MPLMVLPPDDLLSRRNSVSAPQPDHVILKQYIEKLIALSYIKSEFHLFLFPRPRLQKCAHNRAVLRCVNPLCYAHLTLIVTRYPLIHKTNMTLYLISIPIAELAMHLAISCPILMCYGTLQHLTHV
jgi:hypothetical protein